jgi:P27 family predicted phage terminase small subunit
MIGGRKPKSTAAQIAAGDPRKIGARKLKEKLANEPVATKGLPDCPEHLNGRARGAWEFWAVELADMNLDRRPDAQMLEGACVNYGRAVDADLIVERDGLIVDEFGMVGEPGAQEAVLLKRKAHPAIAVSNAAWRQVRAFCSEFGLSPVSRTRLAIERKDDAGDLAKILMQPRAPRPVVQ